MNRVFVLGKTKKPLMPCHPARARQLLTKGRARVYRRAPFTIILQDREAGETQPTESKFDPGSRATGIALVVEGEHGRQVVWAAELHHRGRTVKADLDTRRALRRGRRNRHTRYRERRFDNRARPAGWLPPSLRSRVDNCVAWAAKLQRFAPVTAQAVETVRFDMHLMQRPDIAGIEYQRGTLYGCELREYLLARHRHTCAYCGGGTADPVLECDHVVPRSRGGTDRVANLVMACRTCNATKNNHLPAEWLAQLKASRRPIDRKRTERLERIIDGYRPGLADAAAVNATRFAIAEALAEQGLPVVYGTGGRTRFNRTAQDYPKAHWIDAACVGETGWRVGLDPQARPLAITAIGRGCRQTTRVDKYGFPRSRGKTVKRVLGFQTGDLTRLDQPAGRYAGIHTGRIAVRGRGDFDLIETMTDGRKRKITAPAVRFTLIQRGDGYAYAA